MMPMSFMVTPPSASAPCAASDARSTMSLSGCLPNFVMWMPRIQSSSDADAIVLNLPVVRSRSRRLRCLRRPCRPLRWPVGPSCPSHVLGIGRDVDEVGPHARALAVDDRGHEGHRDAGAAKATMVKARTSPVVATSACLKSVPRRRRSRCGGRRTGRRSRAFVGHQVRVVTQHQVVHQRDLLAMCPQIRVERVSQTTGSLRSGRIARLIGDLGFRPSSDRCGRPVESRAG